MKSLLLTILIASISLLAVACNSSKSATDSLSLTQNHWVLVEINGQPVIHEGANQQASLEFTADGNKVTGSTGCNRMFGTFALSGDEKIQFKGIGSTKIACPDMTVETNFLKALSATNAYGISGKELLLKHDETVVARLRAELSPSK